MILRDKQRGFLGPRRTAQTQTFAGDITNIKKTNPTALSLVLGLSFSEHEVCLMWEPGESIQVLPGSDWILRPLFNKLHKGVLPPVPDGTVMRLRLHFFFSAFLFLLKMELQLSHTTIWTVTLLSLSAALTYFICFTIVLFPDSPAPENGDINYSLASIITVSNNPSEQPLIKANLAIFNHCSYNETHLFCTKEEAKWNVWPAQKGDDWVERTLWD